MALIEKKAHEQGLSLNKTIKLLLKEALGLDQNSNQHKKEQFEEFCGLWKEEEFADFEKQVSDFNEINPDDWK